MSTKMTTSPHGYELAESGSLALVQAIGSFQSRLLDWLVDELHQEGFKSLTGSMLSFLGALDCGENHAAALARTLNVSRQAIHKQVRELETLGWLTTRPHPSLGNQRVIVFTQDGERMMSVARARFARLDEALESQLSQDPAELAKTLTEIAF